MDKEKRRAIGAHYTTEQNILKLIHPAFSRRSPGRTRPPESPPRHRPERCPQGIPEKTRRNPLLRSRLWLRQLSRHRLSRAARARNRSCSCSLNRNRAFDVHELSHVDVNQFYGIEIEEFPVRIAEIALWMMDHIMNMRLSEALGGYFPRIPLKASPTIRNADALEMEWATVLDPAQCTYVLGNPPFGGAKYQTDAAASAGGKDRCLCRRSRGPSITSRRGLSRLAHTSRAQQPRSDLSPPIQSRRANKWPSCGPCFSTATILKLRSPIEHLPGAAKHAAKPMSMSSSSA